MTRVMRLTAALAVLAALLIAGLCLTAPTASAQEGSGSPQVVSTWPENGFVMWVPARQGRITLSESVAAAKWTFTLEAQDGEVIEQPTRLTRGETDRVYFKLPVLAPGSYVLVYDGGTPELTGRLNFDVGPKFTAPGGGNHRHATDHVDRDELDLLAARFILVLGAALVLWASWRRSTRRLADLFIGRLGGALLALGAVVASVQQVILLIQQYADAPLEGVLASPVLWVYLPLAGFGVLQAIAGWRSPWASWTALTGVSLVMLTQGHGTGLTAVMSAIAYAGASIAAAVMLAVSFARTGESLSGTRASRTAALLASTMSLAFLGSAMLPLHAHGFVFNGDFAADFKGRLLALGVLSAGLVVSLVVGRMRGLMAGFLAPIGAAALMAGAAWLLWIPPGTSGL